MKTAKAKNRFSLRRVIYMKQTSWCKGSSEAVQRAHCNNGSAFKTNKNDSQKKPYS